MRSINSVVMVGNLTRDPELKYTQGGTAVATFGVALNSREKQGEEWVDRADFFDVTVFGAQAEACSQHLSKGSLAGVSGRLQQDRWKDKETQANRSKVLVVASSVEFLGSRGRDDADPGSRGPVPAAGEPAYIDEDLPF